MAAPPCLPFVSVMVGLYERVLGEIIWLALDFSKADDAEYRVAFLETRKN